MRHLVVIMLVLWMCCCGSRTQTQRGEKTAQSDVPPTQKISIEQLASMIGADLSDVEDFLISQNWVSVGVKTYNNYDTSNGSANYELQEGSTVYSIECGWSYVEKIDRNIVISVGIEPFNKNEYIKLIEDVERFGGRFLKSEILNGSIVKLYRDDKFTFGIATKKHNEWGLFVLVSEYYDFIEKHRVR